MVNPLSIILPHLFAKPKPATSPPEKNPIEEVEGLVCVLRNVAGVTDDGIGERIYAIASEMSCKTTLNRAEAVNYICSQIMYKINKGMPANEAVHDTISHVTRTYLERPLSIFDKRPDVSMMEDYAHTQEDREKTKLPDPW